MKAQSRIVEGRDLGRQPQDFPVDDDALQLLRQGCKTGGQTLAVGQRQHTLLAGLLVDAGGVLRQQHGQPCDRQLPLFRQRGIQCQQKRPDAADAFEPAFLLLDVGELLTGLVQRPVGVGQGVVLFLPFPGTKLGLIQLAPGGVEICLSLMKHATGGFSGAPKLVGLGFKRFQRLAQMFDARRRLEQHPADIIRCLQDAFTAFDEHAMIEGIKAIESLGIERSEPGIQDVRGQRGVVMASIEDRVLATLFSDEIQ